MLLRFMGGGGGRGEGGGLLGTVGEWEQELEQEQEQEQEQVMSLAPCCCEGCSERRDVAPAPAAGHPRGLGCALTRAGSRHGAAPCLPRRRDGSEG